MILYPFAPLTIIDHLSTRDELDGVDVVPRIPATRPPRFVVISTAPSISMSRPQRPVLSPRRIVAGCWGTTQLSAGTLSETVRALLVDSKYHQIGVRRVDVVGEPAEFPHPTITSHFRWQLTVDLLLRANV